jgi:tRNA-binding protein
MKKIINWEDFEKIDMRVGTIIKAVEFKKASNPSYLIHVDFGEIGIKKTSAQITKNYKLKDLIGKQIVGLINLPKKQIANIQSEFLILGAIDGNLENVVIIRPQSITKNGALIC